MTPCTAGDKITSDPTVTYPTPAAGDVAALLDRWHQLHHHGSDVCHQCTADVSRTVSIEEEDTAGNISGISSLTFTLDTRAPATPAAPVLANDTARRRQDHQQPDDRLPDAPAGDVLLYSLDGSAYTTIAPPTLKIDGTEDGAHTVSIEERDIAGNISGISSLTFTLDTRAPATAGRAGADAGFRLRQVADRQPDQRHDADLHRHRRE